MALAAILAGVGSAVVLGLTPSGGQSVYVVASSGAQFQTGWYVQLTDSSDPVYLLSCQGDQVIAAPKDEIALRTYATAPMWNVSVVGHFVSGQPWPPLGLTPTCPVSPPRS